SGKPLVVVDYAHTPDALEKALSTLQEIKPQGAALWCVFGCGGLLNRITDGGGAVGFDAFGRGHGGQDVVDDVVRIFQTRVV
ncbi:glutamate ligase domain-containing protein, partial [Neisseria gonorrhoeae]|uniref:glutamate ligase domain-containing protein n=1 Tax=Neisseria gonorrhoeae TaxID=485 RepID=UPI0027D936EA